MLQKLFTLAVFTASIALAAPVEEVLSVKTDLVERVAPPVADATLVKELSLMQSFAAAAYCNSKNLKNWSCVGRCSKTPDTQFVVSYDTLLTDTNGYVAYNPSLNAIIVAFRGTNGLNNIIVDLALKLTQLENYPSGHKVHEGFQNSYKAVRSDLRSQVQKLLKLYPSAHIRAIGHSLGGAIATVAALDLAYYFPQQASSLKVFTYGLPRIGSSSVANKINTLFAKRFFRVTHETDLVTYIPTRNFQGTNAWQHPGREYWINGGTTFECDAANNEDPNCSIGLRDYDDLNTLPLMLTLVFWKTFPGDLDDHGNGYYSAFGSNC